MTHEQTVSLNKVSMPIAAVGGIVLIVGGWLAAYYGTVSAQASSVDSAKAELIDKINGNTNTLTEKIGQTNTAAAAERARSDQFEKRMDRFENKLDVLLQHNGINPAAAIMGTR